MDFTMTGLPVSHTKCRLANSLLTPKQNLGPRSSGAAPHRNLVLCSKDSKERLEISLERRQLLWASSSIALGGIVNKARAQSMPTWTAKPQVASLMGPSPALATEDEIAEFGSQPKELVGPMKGRVRRPKKKLSRKEIDDETEEVLVIEGVEVRRGAAVNFDVFVNLPEADSKTSISSPQYAGTFSNVPHDHHHQRSEEGNNEKRTVPLKGPYRKTSFKVGITEILEDLDASEDEDIVVTVVPKGDYRHDPIKFASVRIEYD